MKSKFALVALAGLLASNLISRPAKAQNGPNLGPTNMRALAILGNSYNSFVNSSGYRGRLALSKVTFSVEKGTVTKTLDWSSSWQNAGDGEFNKRLTDGIFTEVSGGVTTSEKFSGTDDGTLSKRYYVNRGMWSERPAIKDFDVSINYARVPLQIAILLVSQGFQFEVADERRNGEDTRVVRTGTLLEVVLDRKTGVIKSWKSEKSDETSSCNWLSQELNPTFKPDEWAFKVPTTAKKVEPDTVNLNMEF